MYLSLNKKKCGAALRDSISSNASKSEALEAMGDSSSSKQLKKQLLYIVLAQFLLG